MNPIVDSAAKLSFIGAGDLLSLVWDAPHADDDDFRVIGRLRSVVTEVPHLPGKGDWGQFPILLLPHSSADADG
jgi:hypothetical protein